MWAWRFFLMFTTEETKDDFNSTILNSNDSCASYRVSVRLINMDVIKEIEGF